MSAQLHILCGLPCSGKTTLAKQLEHELPALRLGPDEWAIELIPDRDTAEVTRIRPILNALQWQLAQDTLKHGCHVVLEHGSWSKQERMNAINTFAGTQVQVHLHYLNVSMDVLKARLANRNTDLPDGTFYISLEKLDEWAPDFVAPDESELALFDSYKIYEPDV